METWGADRYGDPCRECGFRWELSAAEAVASVRAVPDAYAERLTGATGRERHPDLAWTTAAYVCHVTDNLRTWAERLPAATWPEMLRYRVTIRTCCRGRVTITRSRCAGALWSLRWAVDAWTQSAQAALARGVVLRHATRGAQSAEDVARNNAHDAHHHVWDIDRILRAG